MTCDAINNYKIIIMMMEYKNEHNYDVIIMKKSIIHTVHVICTCACNMYMYM